MSQQPREHFDAYFKSGLVEVCLNASQLDDSRLEWLYSLVAKTCPSRLLLDLARVQFVTCNALSKLVTLHHRVRAGGGQLTLANLTPLVYEVFDVTRLTTFLDVRKQGMA